MSRPVCGICMCLEDETGCGCGQNNDQMSNPIAWLHPDGMVEFDVNWASANQDKIEPIPLYTSPQYRELSDDEIKEIENKISQGIACYDDFDFVAFAKAILERAEK